MADEQDQADAAAPTEGEAFLARVPMRDEDGAIRAPFVEEIARGVEQADATFPRRARRRFSSAFRPPSGGGSNGRCCIRRTPPDGACRPISLPCHPRGTW